MPPIFPNYRLVLINDCKVWHRWALTYLVFLDLVLLPGMFVLLVQEDCLEDVIFKRFVLVQ